MQLTVSWPFQDFCRDRDPGLPSMSLKAFAGIIFRHCPGLAHLLNDKQAIFAQFSAYKQAVPVMGAILLNATMDKCLLVRGYKEGSSWGFPRGKLAKDETDAECAVREVRFQHGQHGACPEKSGMQTLLRSCIICTALLHGTLGRHCTWSFLDLSMPVHATCRRDSPVKYTCL